jgi:hypothetical protein
MTDDLLSQARTLATFDTRGRPRQANLRRAVSAAYYAVFHFLVHEACCVQFGTQHAQAAYRHALGRAFTHQAMKQACISFGGGTLKETVIKGLPRDSAGNYSIGREIREIAKTFAELQEKRHLADYDLSERFGRDDVLGLIEQAENHVASFRDLPASEGKTFFLACLWAWRELNNR